MAERLPVRPSCKAPGEQSVCGNENGEEAIMAVRLLPDTSQQGEEYVSVGVGMRQRQPWRCGYCLTNHPARHRGQSMWVDEMRVGRGNADG